MPKIRFLPDGIEAEVPVATTILQAARQCGAHMGSACGGVCACSTCHVYVKTGLAGLSAAEESEEDIIEKAFDVKATSRLGCQSRLEADTSYEVEITSESRKAFLDEHPDLR